MRRTTIASLLVAAAVGFGSPGALAKLSRQTRVVAGAVEERGLFTVALQDGAVVDLGDGTRVTMAPSTALRQLPATDLSLDSAGPTRTHVLVLTQGRVDVLSPTTGSVRSAVMVKGPRKSGAIIRGGEATVIAEDDSATIANLGASVLADLGGDWDPLPIGTARTVGGDGVTDHALPGPPTWQPTQRLLITDEATATLASVSWTAAGASTYEVTLRPAGQQAPLAVLRTSEARLPQPLTLAPGQYVLTVRGFDRHGLAGKASADLTVGVVRVELPPGAFFAPPGSVRLDKGQYADLVGSSGLEMSYRDSAHFTPAGTRLWLLREEPLEVRLRVPGDSASVPLTLAPRGLSAKVKLGPAKVTWPSVPARIEVKLINESGGAFPTWVKPRVTARLGTERLDLEWTRRGDVLRAVVPPRATGGPWVLRVTAEDQYGIELGREFLEIAEDRPAKR